MMIIDLKILVSLAKSTKKICINIYETGKIALYLYYIVMDFISDIPIKFGYKTEFQFFLQNDASLAQFRVRATGIWAIALCWQIGK